MVFQLLLQFDVTENRPDVVLRELWDTLERYARQNDAEASYIKRHLRILVAGGDGTVTWVLGTIATLGLDPCPPVAIMPLGTGNDLSINLGWGNKFKESWIKYSNIYDTLLQYNDAERQPVDYWSMYATAPDGSYYDTVPHAVQRDKDNPSSIKANFWNYFSVGLDAEAAYGFHTLREQHPSMARSRMMNQAWYSVFTCSTGWFCGVKPLHRFASLRIKKTASSDWTEVPVPSSVRALVALNVLTYGGGRDIWGLDNEKHLAKKDLQPPFYNDGLIEIVGFKDGWHTAMVMGEVNSSVLHAKRIAQCYAVEITLSVPARHESMKKYLYMQMDGEPWKQRVPARTPSSSSEQQFTVVIEHGGTSSMLINRKHAIGGPKVQSLVHRTQ